MAGGPHLAVPPRAAMDGALAEGRRALNARPRSAPPGSHALLALQREAGNGAVSALLAARLRSPGERATAEIDGALREVRGADPVIDVVEQGLKAAQAAGIPVELEGPKPPAAALAVTRTGFGPGSVAAKKPVPPPKPVPARSPLAKAAAAGAKGGGGGSRPAGTPGGAAGGTAATSQPASLSGGQLLQPPVAPTGLRPRDDPAFQQVTGGVHAFARAKRSHPPAGSKAQEAQAAALPPSGDLAGQAQAAKVDSMDAQQPGTFDKVAFIAAVKTAIEAKSPRTLSEADNYASSGKAAEVKGDVQGLVGQGKEGQTRDVEAATAAAPDQSKAVPKAVTPMSAEQPGPPATIPAAGAVPKPAPPEQLNLAAGPHQAEQEMAEGGVSDAQLAGSNEPTFTGALADKSAAATHAATAPGEFRQQEQQVIAQGKAEAGADTTGAVAGLQGAKGAALATLVADKGKAKTKDEAKRAEVTTKVQGIFAATETEVKKLLDGIDPKVEAAFNEGEAGARAAFESYVSAKMSAYKKDRYGGWLGGLRWAKDKLVGMPDKVNEFYEAGRELYLKRMDGVISRVADIVGGDLTAAKSRIAAGRAEIASYVKSLPTDLRKVGSEAAGEIGERFAQLESDVDAKQEAVVDTLATRYTEARKGLDERIEALQAENKGLVDKAIGAIKAIVNTIRELAGMLKSVLARAAGVVGEIIKDPIGFLGNLVAGVKGGILKFKDNILGHLRKGLMSWLFGSLAEAGIELPDSFDTKGIVKLLASIFGLTWANIRTRLVKQIGDKAMGAVESGVKIFQVFATEGIGGLWEMLVEKLGDIKEMILDQVKDFVVTKIITAGITWLIGLLNPAAAFIKACKLIYDVVMFFVTNGSRIMTFVNTILDSVADIVKGNVGSVVNKIDNVLGQMVPLIIGFLASAIGLGGIGQKIREIIEKLQKPVNQALDFVIKTGLKLAGPIIRGLQGVGSKIKSKVLGGDDTPEGKQKRLDSGMAAGLSVVNRFRGRTVGERLLKPLLTAVKLRYRMTSLTLFESQGRWGVEGVVNPSKKQTGSAKAATSAGLDGLYKVHQVAQRTVNNDLRAKWKNNTVKKKLAADPAVKARLEREFSRLSKALATDAKTEATFQRLMAGETTAADVAQMFAMYKAHAEAAENLIQRLEDLSKSPAELAAEAESVRAEVSRRHTEGVDILGRAGVEAVLASPTFNQLRSRIKARRDALASAMPALSTKTLAELRDLAGTAGKFRQDAVDAENLSRVADSVEPFIKTIDSICLNTTKEGKEDADTGDGSSEAAAIEEARSGRKIKRRAHGPKCEMEAKGLRRAIAKLNALRDLTSDAGIRSRIDAAILAATQRAEGDGKLLGLDRGATAWRNRVAADPQHLVWNPQGESKVEPGFGKGGG